MPIPSVYVARFFQLVTARQFAEAERILQRLRQKIQTTEWNRGYFQALYGMLLSQRNNDDRYAFLSSMNLNDTRELQNHRREFLKQARSRVHADYDRGYFSAWADYLRILPKLDQKVSQIPKEPSQVQKEEVVEEKETVNPATKNAAKEVTKQEQQKSPEPEKVEVVETAERAEIRQSTLFDFSR